MKLCEEVVHVLQGMKEDREAGIEVVTSTETELTGMEDECMNILGVVRHRSQVKGAARQEKQTTQANGGDNTETV